MPNQTRGPMGPRSQQRQHPRTYEHVVPGLRWTQLGGQGYWALASGSMGGGGRSGPTSRSERSRESGFEWRSIGARHGVRLARGPSERRSAASAQGSDSSDGGRRCRLVLGPKPVRAQTRSRSATGSPSLRPLKKPLRIDLRAIGIRRNKGLAVRGALWDRGLEDWPSLAAFPRRPVARLGHSVWAAGGVNTMRLEPTRGHSQLRATAKRRACAATTARSLTTVPHP